VIKGDAFAFDTCSPAGAERRGRWLVRPVAERPLVIATEVRLQPVMPTIASGAAQGYLEVSA